MSATRREPNAPSAISDDESPSLLIDATVAELGDWRGELLGDLRRLILSADPGVVEEVKWRYPSNAMRGVPTWSRDGIICTGETYKDKVKLTFARGASVPDPTGLFNSSLDGGTRRAIDIVPGNRIDPESFTTLIRAAIEVNRRCRKATARNPHHETRTHR